MRFLTHRTARCRVACSVLALFVAAALAGCSTKSSEQQAVDEFFKNNPKSQSQRQDVAKFAGRVTVDGEAPSRDRSRLFVVLNDPQKLEKPGQEGPKRFTSCDDKGNFEFTTYAQGDGVPGGKYVVTFVKLHRPTRNGVRGMGLIQVFEGPDELKNLYNDPQKNQNEADFVIEVQAPGKADHEFNLSVAGKNPVATPSEYAVTRVRGNG
jgi:hypothetical protein